jgi:hypothetical protein
MTAAAAMGALADLREEGAACRRLWTAVLTRILLDCPRDDPDGDDARRWLTRPDPMVVDFAGLDPVVAVPALARLAGQRIAP